MRIDLDPSSVVAIANGTVPIPDTHCSDRAVRQFRQWHNTYSH